MVLSPQDGTSRPITHTTDPTPISISVPTTEFSSAAVILISITLSVSFVAFLTVILVRYYWYKGRVFGDGLDPHHRGDENSPPQGQFPLTDIHPRILPHHLQQQRLGSSNLSALSRRSQFSIDSSLGGATSFAQSDSVTTSHRPLLVATGPSPYPQPVQYTIHLAPDP
ncbi:hypothetical protein BJ742DRAFT_857001 [Cladochytrium replicatum]|nr:hypothetical protein BJ742DRAFT_857001 [Cladochytrium replicatum]